MSSIASAELAGAGFINFRLAKDAWFAELRNVAPRAMRTDAATSARAARS